MQSILEQLLESNSNFHKVIPIGSDFMKANKDKLTYGYSGSYKNVTYAIWIQEKPYQLYMIAIDMETMNVISTPNATSLKQVNKAIGEKFPGVFLVRGAGYYYIASNDDTMAEKIAGLYTSSIGVYRITQQTVEQWIKDVEYLLSDVEGTKLHY
jgi:hypothetical protein